MVVLVSINLKFTILDLFIIFIPAHGKAGFASVAYGMSGISVCLSVRPSVTLRYCVKTRKRRRMQSTRVAQCLRFSDAKNG